MHYIYLEFCVLDHKEDTPIFFYILVHSFIRSLLVLTFIMFKYHFVSLHVLFLVVEPLRSGNHPPHPFFLDLIMFSYFKGFFVFLGLYQREQAIDLTEVLSRVVTCLFNYPILVYSIWLIIPY